MISTVAYYRMSSDRQETSIPDQRVEVNAYAAKHDYQIIREYQDEGISGDDTEKRAAFQKMLRDAKDKGDFEAILCWDQDRFGRFDPLEAGYWVKPLRDLGVRLETVGQGRIDWDDFAGRIIYAVQQEGKHAFLKDLARNTLRGKLRRAMEGKWLGGRPPFGYDLRDHRLIPGSPDKVEFVAWLFRTYAVPGATLRTLMKQINARGIPASNGGLWRLVSIRKILRCPLYVGDFVWNRLRNSKYYSLVRGELTPMRGRRRGTPTQNPDSDLIIIRNTHEPLIDRATWEAVQLKLLNNKALTTPHRGGGGFALCGLVFCGNCGNRMHGMTDKRGPYRCYQCSGYSGFGRVVCERYRVPEQPLIDCIVRKIQQDFLNSENLTKLEHEIARQLDARSRPDSAVAQRLRDRIAKLDHQISQGAERVLASPPELVEVLTSKLREWQQERGRLQGELKVSVAPSVATVLPTVGQALDQLRTLAQKFKTADPSLLREVIRQAVAKVECWFERRQRGRLMVRTLARGTIHLRPDLLVVRDVHNVSTLWPPAAATTRARLANSWPRTSVKSTS